MKSIALLSLALVVAAAAHAEAGAEDFNLQNRPAATASGTLTRAEVQAEYMRAAAAGEIQNGESMLVINQQAGSARDVGSVREEAVQAARKHPQDSA